jgi:hypothetical protein
MAKRCDTCERRQGRHGCKARKVAIGRKADCWAWTDNAFWEAEFMAAAEKYASEKCYKNHAAGVAG